jgi:hypothetical protein
VISVQTIVLPLESLQIRRNHNWLKSLSFFFSQTLSGVTGCTAMTDLEGKLERFETLAAESERIAKLATDGAKRELYLRLALHYRELAADMRKEIATKDAA